MLLNFNNKSMMRGFVLIISIAYSTAFLSLDSHVFSPLMSSDGDGSISDVDLYFTEDSFGRGSNDDKEKNSTELTKFESSEKEAFAKQAEKLKPFCGVEDDDVESIISSNSSLVDSDTGRRRLKRYVRGVGKFKLRRLKYIVLKFTKDVSRSFVDTTMKRALDLWAKYTNLEFVETLNKEDANIRISFVTGDHGDGYPFLPGSRVLAHASYPYSPSTFAHFNDLYDFRIEKLYPLAVHEFGHNLGLAHCRTKEPAVMCNTFSWNEDKGLHANDIAGIQSIYGKKRKTKKQTKPSVNICSELFSFDAVYFDHRTEAIYGIKRRFYWKINDFGVMKGFPKKVRSLWKMFPGNIDAAFHSKSSYKIYFFKENMVWRYKGGNLDPGFPRLTSRYNIPSNVDAAISIAGKGSYVIKGKFAYKFNERPKRGDRRRRRLVNKLFPGAPSDIDAAIQWRDGNVYLFKDKQYWRVPGQNNAKGLRPFPGWRRFQGIRKPSGGRFPKNMQKYWIGCKPKKSKAPRKSRFSSRRLKKN